MESDASSLYELAQCEPGAAAAAAVVKHEVKQEWSIAIDSSVSLQQLEQQFRESVLSERKAATGYLLTQGVLLLQLLQRAGARHPCNYGQPRPLERARCCAPRSHSHLI